MRILKTIGKCGNCKRMAQVWLSSNLCGECSKAINAAAIGNDAHSLKGLKTLEDMGTKAADWGLTEIKWVKEMRNVATKVSCPTCHGTGQMKVWKETGEKYVNPFKNDYGTGESTKWNTFEFENRSKVTRVRCEACPPRRGWGAYGTGQVVAMVMREVSVGYPQWAKDTRMDSRFNQDDQKFRIGQKNENGRVLDVCELCSKSITSSWTVPVTGKGADGRIHGMYVGMDCARKFFGIKNFKTDDKVMEVRS